MYSSRRSGDWGKLTAESRKAELGDINERGNSPSLFHSEMISESMCNENISILHSKRTPRRQSIHAIFETVIMNDLVVQHDWISLRVGSDNLCIFIRRGTTRLGANHR